MTEIEKDVQINHSLDNIKEESVSANKVPYKASEAEKPLDIINVFDLELEAEKVIPTGGYGYISSGAGDLWTIKQNIESFNHKLIVPRVLKNIENILKIIEDKNIQANFFVDGYWLERNNSLLTEIINKGYIVGNLSYNMDYNNSAFSWMDTIIKRLSKEKLVIVVLLFKQYGKQCERNE